MGFIGNNCVNSIEYEKTGIDRRILRIEVRKPSKNKVLVIMKNPSSTCDNGFLPIGKNTITTYSDKAKCHIDRTTGKVLRKLKGTYDEIFVLNLYSLYDSNPLNVDSYYYGNASTPIILNLNNTKVQTFINSFKGDVICAWGKANGIRQPEYNNQIKNISSFFNANHNLLEYDPTSKSFINRTASMYPPHGLIWE